MGPTNSATHNEGDFLTVSACGTVLRRQWADDLIAAGLSSERGITQCP